jgi:two-component sensor histidine kinase/PAS domain-containing protein
METPEPEPAAQDKTAAAHTAQDNAAASPQPIAQPRFFPHPELIPLVLDTAQIGIWAWDIALHQPTWSSNVAVIHGTHPDTAFAGTLADLEKLIDAEDRPGVAAAIQEALLTHKPSRARYRLVARPGVDERWIETVATVVLKDGAPAQLVGICWDVTEGARAHRELRIRASQQEAVARLADHALIESDLQQFFEEAVATIAEILDVELVKILELVPGDAELLLRAGVGWQPGFVGAAYISTSRDTQAGFTLASGGPVITENLEHETRFIGAPLLREHNAVSGVSTPIAGRDGRAYGVLTAHATRRRKFNETDVSFLMAVANVVAGAIQRLQLDWRQELMIRELRHRSGNLFSQLLALFAQTAKNSRTVADLVTKYEARVLALANAHRLITEGGWESAALTKILNTVLTPYLERIAFAGPDVLLEPDAAFGVSMAVHELATNATKFGSLSCRPGRVEVTWTVDRGERGLTLALRWKEFHGPRPKRNPKPGFGTRLINMVITRQLNGEVEQQFGADGLNARLLVPMTRERWPSTRAADVQVPP